MFLYTCWHVVTELNPNQLKVPLQLPERRSLGVTMTMISPETAALQTIGGAQSFTVPLYEDVHKMQKPLWYQDDQHVPNEDLNNVGLFVPFWHDVVKLKIPNDVHVHDYQLIDETRLAHGISENQLGEKCFVVGFPFGYSTLGNDQPTPVVLTRFVAGNRIESRRQQILLGNI